MICLKPWEFPPPLKKMPVVKFVKKRRGKKQDLHYTFTSLLLQWLVISQLAILHLWHLHASKCQSKHSVLPKGLCMQLSNFVYAASYTAGPGPLGPTRTSHSIFWDYVFEPKTPKEKQEISNQQQESKQSLPFYLIEDISKDQEERPSSWAAQVPQHTRFYPPSIL